MTKRFFAGAISLLLFAAGCARKEPACSYATFHGREGWGYDILVNETVVIHQENMPVLSDSRGFRSEAQAAAAAALVLKKIRARQRPALTAGEVQALASK